MPCGSHKSARSRRARLREGKKETKRSAAAWNPLPVCIVSSLTLVWIPATVTADARRSGSQLFLWERDSRCVRGVSAPPIAATRAFCTPSPSFSLLPSPHLLSRALLFRPFFCPGLPSRPGAPVRGASGAQPGSCGGRDCDPNPHRGCEAEPSGHAHGSGNRPPERGRADSCTVSQLHLPQRWLRPLSSLRHSHRLGELHRASRSCPSACSLHSFVHSLAVLTPAPGLPPLGLRPFPSSLSASGDWSSAASGSRPTRSSRGPLSRASPTAFSATARPCFSTACPAS